MTRILSAGKYRGMRRMADPAGRFKMTAVDQRPPIENPIRAVRGTSQAPWEDVAAFKEMLVRELQGHSSAMLLDPHYAFPRGVTLLDARLGMILTLEDSAFRETPGGRLSAPIDDWSVEKIKRAGGAAVKVLTWYRPDAADAVCREQQDFTALIGEACRRYDLPYVFELLVLVQGSPAFPRLGRDRARTARRGRGVHAVVERPDRRGGAALAFASLFRQRRPASGSGGRLVSPFVSRIRRLT